jgi:aldehyde reductase
MEFCENNNIFLTAYGPLGSPKRSWAGPEEDAILDEPVVKQVAEKYKKTNAQILIKFQVIVLFIDFSLYLILLYLII